MNVPSYQFLAFSAVAAVVVWLAGTMKLREAALLLANAWFIATFSADWRTFVPFAGFLALGYLGMRAMERPATRRLFLPALLGVLLVFFWLKRYTFLPSAMFLPIASLATRASTSRSKTASASRSSHGNGSWHRCSWSMRPSRRSRTERSPAISTTRKLPRSRARRGRSLHNLSALAKDCTRLGRCQLSRPPRF